MLVVAGNESTGGHLNGYGQSLAMGRNATGPEASDQGVGRLDELGLASGGPEAWLEPELASAQDPRLHSPLSWRSQKLNLAGCLVLIGSAGCLTNLTLLAAILCHRGLRRASSAFIMHHCLLDLLKAGHSFLFALGLASRRPPPHCNLLAGGFIVCLTSTAFNLLAMAMHTAHRFADLAAIRAGLGDESTNCWCVAFSIAAVWFASIVLNLGVAFLPGTPAFQQDVGYCTFRYGVTRNYVLHFLFVSLVSLALGLTCVYLRLLYRDLLRCGASHLGSATALPLSPADSPSDCRGLCRPRWWWPLTTTGRKHRLSRRTVGVACSMDPSLCGIDGVLAVENAILGKLYALLLLVALFILFWYPLFMLTLVDRHFKAPPQAYTIAKVFALSCTLVNPFILCLSLWSHKNYGFHPLVFLCHRLSGTHRLICTSRLTKRENLDNRLTQSERVIAQETTGTSAEAEAVTRRAEGVGTKHKAMTKGGEGDDESGEPEEEEEEAEEEEGEENGEDEYYGGTSSVDYIDNKKKTTDALERENVHFGKEGLSSSYTSMSNIHSNEVEASSNSQFSSGLPKGFASRAQYCSVAMLHGAQFPDIVLSLNHSRQGDSVHPCGSSSHSMPGRHSRQTQPFLSSRTRLEDGRVASRRDSEYEREESNSSATTLETTGIRASSRGREEDRIQTGHWKSQRLMYLI
ncbi:unnamed protein product [Protopolystoma xenopodis]|uniref:G-protein coupled receptors family 1 profile domain-containing protein n=1 Tax=Protopolystoma xenopodis TaxID=117903 RepID=A0A448WMW7_9PLAT|nr:unnamed protein product [Protopolystoma xenopodis]